MILISKGLEKWKSLVSSFNSNLRSSFNSKAILQEKQ